MNMLQAARRFVVDTFYMRLLSFILNQLIIRFANPVIIGVAAIQLELLLSSLLFLSREAIRLALLRANISEKIKFKQFINLSWIPALFLLLIWVSSMFFKHTWSPSVSPQVVQLYILGALFEVCGEPFFNFYNHQIQLRPRVFAESIAVTTRSLATYILVIYFKMGIKGFGIAQVCYGMVYFTILLNCNSQHQEYHNYTLELTDFNPSFLTIPKESKHKPTYYQIFQYQFGAENLQNLYATGPFFIFKHILTEGDKIVLSSIHSNYDQGIYAVLNNYVSLIARIVFYPIEESSRIAFSQMTIQLKNEKSNSDSAAILRLQCQLLYRLTLSISIFGLLFPLFGVNYARLAINLFLGSQWRREETVNTLVAFCPYVLILGLNGITEAYVHTVIPSFYFGDVNLNLFNSSIVFSIVAFPLVASFGTAGVVMANTISMAVRILLNFQLILKSLTNAASMYSKAIDPVEGIHVTKLYQGFSIPRVDEYIPLNLHLVLCACFLLPFASSIKYARSTMNFFDGAEHVAIGICCLAYYSYSVWQSYESELGSIYSSFFQRGGRTGE